MPEHFTFKTYAWSLGTTSFRMADFHRKVEKQLLLLQEFWENKANKESWTGNKKLQVCYYNYLYEKKFIFGDIKNDDKKAKTARQKTSGLVDIGLINDDRRLTSVGKKLLEIVKSGDFSADNIFQIPKDSFLYLKQIIKTSCRVDLGYVRPFLVTGRVLQACNNYLTEDEFTYLLPLCVTEEITNNIIYNILKFRQRSITIDDIITNVVLTRYDYPHALAYFLSSSKEDDVIMSIGMNRDGIKHDRCYVKLYRVLYNTYINKNYNQIDELYAATKELKGKIGNLWRRLLFGSIRKPSSTNDLTRNMFSEVANQKEFDVCFFNYIHLIKIKATLLDYKDLNRRYFSITDAFLFNDGKFSFSPIFESFFEGTPNKLFDDAYNTSLLLYSDVELEEINKNLIFEENDIIKAFNSSYKKELSSINEVYDCIESERYLRFRQLIDSKFTNDVIISMLPKFENRQSDNDILNFVGGEADIPTIFEYIIGIAWYRLSGYQGKILDYMKLSLDMDLLPRTHASGGESDIVYEYEETQEYPRHTLLIECTLMEGTNARRGEMEPVSRHLANYMIDKDMNSYCTFISNNLHSTVISDFRMRLNFPWYRSDTEGIDGMRILPLHTTELKTVLEKNIKYSQLYSLFMKACDSDIKVPPQWYDECIKNEINNV